jgi:hypothetical protein
MKKYSTFVAIRRMQIKTTLRFHLRIVLIKKTSNNKCWQGYGGEGTYSLLVGM